MKKKILPFLLFLFVTVFLSGCFGEKMTLSELMTQGVAAAVNGDWNVALEYAERAIKVAPDDVNALILLALAEENTGDADAALGTISKATAVDENNYFAQYTRGRLLYEKRHFDSCIAPLRTALKLRPNATDPLILLAQSSVNLKDTQNAKSYYSQLARNRAFARNPAVWSELGMTFIAESNPRNAAQYLVYAAAVKKQNHEPYGMDSAMAKLFAAEAANEVTRKAVQLFGGYGYTREYPVERMMRDAKITEIYEGTSEVQRMVISRALGVK